MIDRLTRGPLPLPRGLRAAAGPRRRPGADDPAAPRPPPTSAWLFGEVLAGGALLGALQKDGERVNLQLEGDGPLRGLFVDADPDGNVRGYVRGAGASTSRATRRPRRARALGASGFLSVLRARPTAPSTGARWSWAATTGRGAAPLVRGPASRWRRRWRSRWCPPATSRSGEVAALLVQRLPGGDAAAVADAGEAIAARRLPRGPGWPAPRRLAVLEAVAGPGFELLADQEVAYRCGCGLDRVSNAVTALGADGIADLVATVGRAEVDCEFCHAHYVLEADELRDLERRLRRPPGPESTRAGPAAPANEPVAARSSPSAGPRPAEKAKPAPRERSISSATRTVAVVEPGGGAVDGRWRRSRARRLRWR